MTSDQSGLTKTFEVKIDATIEAPDLDGALDQIASYYFYLWMGLERGSPYTSGSASIRPLEIQEQHYHRCLEQWRQLRKRYEDPKADLEKKAEGALAIFDWLVSQKYINDFIEKVYPRLAEDEEFWNMPIKDLIPNLAAKESSHSPDSTERP